MNPASALVSASTQLLEEVASGHRPLSSVSGSLADLATELGVEQVMVAIDDSAHGRQVFSSGRSFLGDHGELLVGPPRAVTEPPSPLDDALARLIVASVSAAFERARAGAPTETSNPLVAPTSATPAGPATTTDMVASRTSEDDLLTRLRAAADGAKRYGWGFTLVLLLLDADDAAQPPSPRAQVDQIESHLRTSDTLVEIGTREYAILLAAAGGDEVPRLLARVGRDGAVSTFCYGLAACPGDETDADALLALATARLHEARDLREQEASSR